MLLFVGSGGIPNQSLVLIGLQFLGHHYSDPKRREAWVSGNSGISTRFSSPNLLGACYLGKIVFALRY